MVKIGVIGLGKMGISHLAIVNQIDGVNVVGVCDTSQIVVEGFKQLSSFKTYMEYRKMIEVEQPDAVIVATPSHTHYDIAKYVLQKNIHLFIEKPFSLKYEHAKHLFEIAKDRKLVNQVGYHNRFIETFRYARKIVMDGLLGDIYHFEGRAYGPAITKESKSWRASNNVGGGCLFDYGSHVINLITFLLGNIRNVKSSFLKKIYSKEVEDFVSATLELDNEISGQINLNWSDTSVRRMTTQIFIYGKKGKLIVDSQEVKIFLREGNNSLGLNKGWNIKYITDLERDNNMFFVRGEEYSKQLMYFIDFIKEKNSFKDNINSFEKAKNTNYTIDLIKVNQG